MATEDLIKAGYRVTSRKHRMVSRIDRADWKEVMAKTHVNGMKWVLALGEGSAEDYYRRCISNDTLTVSSIEGIPNSGHQITGFRG